MNSDLISGALLDAVLEELSLAVVILDDHRVMYENAAARALAGRLAREYNTNLTVLLRDHIDAVQSHIASSGGVVSLVTAGNGEPFYFHVRRPTVPGVEPCLVVCIRQLAPERDAVKRFYKLSEREAEVAELVLRGYGNRDVAAALGITPATAKKHLSSIFNKVGVDTRSQLISRLA